MNRAISLRLGALALCVAVLSACNERSDQTAVPTHETTAEQIVRGGYLAKAADCAACHTMPGGAPFAGGVRLGSPFGTFYAPNISPDAKDGIGGWSEADFVTAMWDGTAPDGSHLFPAFPYDSYRHMQLDDVRDLFAYLKTLPPVTGKARDHEIGRASCRERVYCVV